MGLRLNLGCGKDYREGYVNCDILKEVNPDKIVDLEKKLPFKDNSVEEILANHILEHISNFENFLKEIYRISKKGSRIHIRVPFFSHESAFSHYQHKRFFTWTSFDLFNPTHPEHFHSGIKFKVKKKELRSRFMGNKTLFNLFPRIYQEYFCWIFPIKEIYYELIVLK